VGKPNVGKSTLLNAILGEERVIVSDQPGTTRDSVDTFFKRGDNLYTLIDTAGIKRRGRNKKIVEKISVSASIMSLERCDVALVVCDATEGITRQDQHVAGYALEAGRATVLVINKWDLVDKSPEHLKLWNEQIEATFKFAAFSPAIYVSALTKKRVQKIFDLVDIVYKEFYKRIPTSEFNDKIQEIINRRKPPAYKGREVKIKYATQVAVAPPTFVLFTNFPEAIHFSYERYVENQIRREYGFAGCPIRIFFRKQQ
jgi:GTP-binding protein